MTELIERSAKALAAAIRGREVSAYAVVLAAIARIEAVNPQLNAVVQARFGAALAEAQEADERLRQGESVGPLHGVPMTIKDSFDTADLISTAGTKGRSAYVPAEDATVVARLRAAGAILLGKTNTPELTLEVITDNYVYGRTNNPYAVTRTPGGSSGGAAAIIAAGGVPFDIGTDTGGSIRLPSHCCGTAGLKPTAGRVPRTGHIISYDIGHMDLLTHVGPMARYVEDLGLLLPIIAGSDWRDPVIVPAPLGEARDVALPSLRVAFYCDNGIATPTQETVEVVEQAVQALAARGAAITEARPPRMEESDGLLVRLFLADGGAAVRRLLRQSHTDLGDMHPSLAWTQSQPPLPAAELSALMAEWSIYRSQMLAFMEEYDAILCPASAAPAPQHDDPALLDPSYASAYNLTGWPAVVVRGGTSREGLPIGVQVVARPWREDVALAVAQEIERVTGGWQAPVL